MELYNAYHEKITLTNEQEALREILGQNGFVESAYEICNRRKRT